MKGYKAFKKGLICRDKQYAENTVFEEKDAVICSKGMHFCKDPLAVLDYYPLVDENGDMSEFAEVETLDDALTDDNQKYCTKKLKVGAKIDFAKLVQASVNFEYEKVTETKVKNSRKDYAQIGSSGNYAQIGSSGYSAQIGSSGNSAKIGSSGNYAQIGSSGNSAQIGSSGNYAQIGSSGNYAQIGSSGNYAQIGSSGNSAQIGSSGNYAQIGSSGYSAKINSTGKNAVIMCAGNNSIAKAKIGSWITLAEWKMIDGIYTPINVKTEKVDGERIKEDTYYKLVEGEFVEA